jgi:uncharacterized membrane protein YkvA (DUF1232 family)
VVAYTLSPIDLIPDFIPVLGYLDDLIITPLGVALVLKIIPEEVMIEARQKAEITMNSSHRASRIGTFFVLGIWFLVGLLSVLLIMKLIHK